MPRRLCSRIQCFTHRLEAEAFKLFEQSLMYINICELKEDGFTLEISDAVNPSLDDDTFAKKSHAIYNLYLVALNVCTMGLFLNQDRKYLSSSYTFLDAKKKQRTTGAIVHNIFDTDLSGQVITQNQVSDSLLLYGALAKEKNSELVSEYLKGLIHLSLNYPGTHFEKDAFANFYRTFEHLVTGRMLNKKKLKNEFKEICDALKSLGIGPESIEEFRKLYILRGSQAMHSQNKPQKIDREDTMKMKAFTDIVTYRVYKPIWEKGIEEKSNPTLHRTPISGRL